MIGRVWGDGQALRSWAGSGVMGRGEAECGVLAGRGLAERGVASSIAVPYACRSPFTAIYLGAGDSRRQAEAAAAKGRHKAAKHVERTSDAQEAERVVHGVHHSEQYMVVSSADDVCRGQ